jgi:vesicle-fusing ATPase
LVTTSLPPRPDLMNLQMSDLFDTELYVPPISTLPAIQHAITELELFSDSMQLEEALMGLEDAGFGKGDEFERAKRAIGVKKLLSIVEMVRQESTNVPTRLVTAIMGSSI